MDLDLLRLKERIEIALELGESHYREFKTALEGRPGEKIPRELKNVCNDISKTLVAFANADGGELFVGIEDDNTVTGLPYNEEKVNAILNTPTNYVLKETPLPLKKAAIIDYNGLKVAFFSVEKGAKYVHLTSKGECFQRKDRESVPTASESIRFVREEAISREYDRKFTEFANVNDLDLGLVERVSSYISKYMSPEKFLQYLELAEFDGTRLNLRKAALLLFAKNINKWHPRSQVRILRVKGTEEKTGENFNVEELADVNGNVFSLIEDSWEALRPHLTETRFSKDAIFKTQIIYPELACKEALINAITHRDYSIEGRGIEIRIFDDRLEILSPGKLLSSITVEDLEELKGVHQTRNTYIGRVLREYGYIRELGEGIRRMFDLMKSNELVPPKIESPNKSFIVTLFYKYIYTKEEKIWLSNFEHFNLSRAQKTVIRLGIDGRLISPKEIWESVGIVDTEDYRQLLEGLRRLGILVSDIPKTQVQNLARSRKISVKSIPRFKVFPPNNTTQKSGRRNRVEEELDKSDYSKIYVGNLDYIVTEKDLIDFFSSYGTVSHASIPKDYFSGMSRGFGFVEFESKESAKEVLKDRKQKYILGKRVFIQEYKNY
jgi:ATP-dependent DNA helicase RecG